MAIEAHQLSFSYDQDLILKQLSFSVAHGEFIGIVGPNGGGKTTLLKLVMGLLRPTKGALSVLGMSPKTAREKISYVPQILRCDRNFPLSVFELVLGGLITKASWWGKIAKENKEQALAILEKVGLADLKERAFGTLSGGQAQRALIARALVSNPELLLLDEPTASVDPKAEAEIHDILHTINEEMTILMVTHDLKAIMEHVSRVFCIQQTLLILEPKEVCEHFAIGLYHPPLALRGQK